MIAIEIENYNKRVRASLQLKFILLLKNNIYLTEFYSSILVYLYINVTRKLAEFVILVKLELHIVFLSKKCAFSPQYVKFSDQEILL